tara:strand:- start:5426 stop:5590 length:165 start_codon:yes stop_codon:yes gene_type:complete
MNPQEIEKAMMKNILQKTGKGFEDWVKIITTANLEKKYSIGHFYAHLITEKSSL